MKTEINNIFLGKASFLFYKILLWVIIGVIFVAFSIFIPPSSSGIYKEIVVFLCLVLVVNVCTSILFSKISKRSRLNNVLIFAISILICTLFEILLFYKEFKFTTHSFTNITPFYIVTLCYIFLRNLAIFVFFLWIESLYQLIILYEQKEKVYQKEMALLIEKQEFEKKFSRKRLLSHYFFNILEHLYANFLIFNSDNVLLDKIKFILYYFLVDAEKDTINLDKELEFYKYYIDLEKLRSNKETSVKFIIFGKTEDFTIIPLLFEPLIGNAMKHTRQDGAGFVDIRVDALHFPVLHFHCKNNFSNSSSNIVSSENGLKILEQRLELCYKNNYELKFEQNDEYYEVRLSVTVPSD
jgi:sensor histidine kinase YesM